jgi:stringent starvation protein B
MEYVTINGQKVPKFKVRSESTITNIKTKHIYEDEDEVKADILKQNARPEDIRRDVKIIIPKGLDVFGKNPLKK